MNEIALSQGNNLLKCIQSQGIHCELREINTGNVNLNKTGVYLLAGLDENVVKKFSNFNANALYDEYLYQSENDADLFTNCQIFKLTDQDRMIEFTKILDYAHCLAFLKEKMNEFGYKIPNKCDYSLVLAAIDDYNLALNLKLPQELCESHYKSVKILCEFFGSGEKDIKEFLDKKGYSNRGETNQFSYLKDTKYISKSPNNIPIEKIKRPIESIGFKYEDLPLVEKELEKMGVKYYISETGIKTNDFGKYVGPERDNPYDSILKAAVYHQVYFFKGNEQKVVNLSNELEFPELKKHAKAITHPNYETGNKRNIFAVEVPVYILLPVLDALKQTEANYYYDVNAVYCDSDRNKIGLFTDNDMDRNKLQRALEISITEYMKYNIIDKTLEKATLGHGKEQEDARRLIATRNEQKQIGMDER